MNNISPATLFTIGFVIGFLICHLFFKVRKVGTIDISQYDDGSSWKLSFDVDPDVIEQMKEVSFEVRVGSGYSQK